MKQSKKKINDEKEEGWLVGWLDFYVISTLVYHLMPNPVYIYIQDLALNDIQELIWQKLQLTNLLPFRHYLRLQNNIVYGLLSLYIYI